MFKTLQEQKFDVIIIGGGVAGSCSAIRLSQLFESTLPEAAFRKISIIEEKKDFGTFKVGESLPSEAKPLLQSLGVLDKIINDVEQGKHLHCFGNTSAWGSKELHGTDSIFNPYGSGFHLDRSLFEETLLNAAESQFGRFVTVLRGFSVIELSFGKEINNDDIYWKVMTLPTQVPNPIYGKILIDASGRRCCIRKFNPNLKRCSFDKLLSFACLFESTPKTCKDIPTKDTGSHTLQKIRMIDEFRKLLKENASYINQCIKDYEYHPIGNRIWCLAANSEALSSFGILTALYNSKIGAEAVFFQFFHNKRIKMEINQNTYSEKSKNSINQQDDIEIQPIEIYQQKMMKTLNDYRKVKNYFYCKEQRWPDEIFWTRRHFENIDNTNMSE
ncbi:26897_t:CDS:2 [Dentiscutata erythropus]|uniref:26897_t:CDS:1 n=1 Tax=Dentiscutata erythropus TaxID=1348616 RepID=A0A9N9HSP9_9GLOM|nr:26897_t:CDS:2 [Dentiscutata erythropus]